MRERINRYELYRAEVLAAKAAEKILLANEPERTCRLCRRKFRPKRLKQIYCGINCPGFGEEKE